MGILGRYPLPVGAVRFSPDGKRLATTGLSTNPFTAETECRIWDLASRGRPHPVTLWGGLALIASQPLRFWLMGTPAWLAFAGWAVSLLPG